MLYPAFLTLHLTALVVMAGTTLIDFVSYQTFWKIFYQQKQAPAHLLQLLARLPRLAGIGAAVLITTGIGMMGLTHGVFGEQLWFRIKFGLVILLILNSLLIGRRNSIKLQKLMAGNGLNITEQAGVIKANLSRFHIMQLLIFLGIIFLSVFKFN